MPTDTGTYNHEMWQAAHGGAVETVASIVEVLDATLPYLKRARAGDTQIQGTNAAIGRGRDLASDGTRILDETNARYRDLNAAVTRAGGDVAGVKAYHA